ncbi:hypothetical protein ACIBJC_05010 [Streptomyces sp. NPDC050509]|uniref:hypothetical protein n=1 Tax=Streptomyces sp. NPDC050509 TaxID=3365620 RepID=UPI00379D3809
MTSRHTHADPPVAGEEARDLAAIGRWLVKTAGNPEIARADWVGGRPAMLPLGVRFDAVKMPPPLVHAATVSTVPTQVCAALADLLGGPVVCHPGVWYYALVPAGTTETWHSPYAVVLGRGAWLGTPRPDRTTPGPTLPYWAVPPERSGRLCAPDAVADLLRAGAKHLEPPGHAELYRARLDHLEACASCGAGTLCDAGKALREAAREARDAARLP